MNTVNLFFAPVLRQSSHNITLCNCDLMTRQTREGHFSHPKLRNYSYLIAARIDSILLPLSTSALVYTPCPSVNAYETMRHHFKQCCSH